MKFKKGQKIKLLCTDNYDEEDSKHYGLVVGEIYEIVVVTSPSNIAISTSKYPTGIYFDKEAEKCFEIIEEKKVITKEDVAEGMYVKITNLIADDEEEGLKIGDIYIVERVNNKHPWITSKSGIGIPLIYKQYEIVEAPLPTIEKTEEPANVDEVYARVCTDDVMLSINRKGEFDIDVSQAHSSQCGRESITHYRYEVKIEAMNKDLSKPDMFVLDNGMVDRYFVEKYVEKQETCFSCEVMAVDAIRHFKSLFIGMDAPYRYIDVRTIKVIIHGSDISFITGEWKKS